MDILARRLTIITLLMAIFAILLAAAVESDYRRNARNAAAACNVPHFCQATL